MYDISIASTKVRGRPKGRPNPFTSKGGRLEFPEPMKSYNKYFNKLDIWKANSIYRKAQGNLKGVLSP